MLRPAFILCVYFAACVPHLAQDQERELPDLAANLDALLNFTQLWQWSSEDFEKAYVVKLADPEQQEDRCLASFVLSNDSHLYRFSLPPVSNQYISGSTEEYSRRRVVDAVRNSNPATAVPVCTPSSSISSLPRLRRRL